MTEQRPNENTIRAVARILRTARKEPAPHQQTEAGNPERKAA